MFVTVPLFGKRSAVKIGTLTILTIMLLSVPAWATRPLRVHPENPRYFTDDLGQAIYLAGHQSFVDLQDNSFNKEFTRAGQRKLDWGEYLDFLSEHHFNYLRSWTIWSTGSGSMAPVNHAIASPMPYQRVEGKGKARDGGDKFDLDQFDEQFFQRMRSRCEDLQDRGIYVSIMLFEVYGFLGGEACGEPRQTLWDGNVFNRANNVNGIDTDDNGDGKGIEFFYTNDKRVLALQRAYVRKAIDTVNHLDNIFYEIANELYAPDWQYHMIEFIKDYERSKPKQHLVLMSPGGRTWTGQWQQMPRDILLSSPADCFAVAGSWDSGRYGRKNPPANNTGKPAIVDLDHVSPGSDDIGFVWSAFTRGYDFNLYDHPFEKPDTEGPDWERIRRNLGQTVAFARRMDLVHAAPHDDLASTGFCLAKPGEQYVVYQPGNQSFEVSGLETGKAYHFEWYDTVQCSTRAAGEMTCTSTSCSLAPLRAGMVLFWTHSER
jgi:hypothetical protein